MDFAELIIRHERLQEAQRPIGATLDHISWVTSIPEPRHSPSDHVIVAINPWTYLVGYGERGTFSQSGLFLSETGACVDVWNSIAGSASSPRRSVPAWRVPALQAPVPPGVSLALVETQELLSTSSDVDFLASHVGSEIPYAQRLLAMNPNTDPEVLGVIAHGPDFAARWNVARNPSAPARLLMQWAYDADYGLRWGVAQNPQTPSHVLKRLADDDEYAVRLRVAENTSTNEETLAVLAADPSTSIRIQIATNPRTPQEVLFSMIADPDPWVSAALARNPSVGDEILTTLSYSMDANARAAATRRLAELGSAG